MLLHGLYCCKEFWENYLPLLPENCHAIVPDLPGHGDSDECIGHSVPQYVATMGESLDTLGVERASLVGHSMGGAIALAFALAYRERVERLLLVMTPFTERGISPVLRALLSPVLNVGAHALNRWYFRLQCCRERKHRVWSRLLLPSRRTIVKSARGLKAFKNTKGFDGAAELAMPILCLHSPGDPTLGYQQRAAAHTMLPQARHEVILRASHAWPMHHGQDFARFANPFLSSNSEGCAKRAEP